LFVKIYLMPKALAAAIIAGQLGDTFWLYKTFRILYFLPVFAILLIVFLPEKNINSIIYAR
jgi:hypothetical protein